MGLKRGKTNWLKARDAARQAASSFRENRSAKDPESNYFFGRVAKLPPVALQISRQRARLAAYLCSKFLQMC